MKTEFIIRAFEEEFGDDLYKVTVPKGTDDNEVIKMFEKAYEYVKHSGEYCIAISDKFDIDIEKLYDIQENNLTEYIKYGIDTFDEYFEKMLEVEDSHRIEIFQYYITECMGWKMENIVYDYEFEW